ncbi:MAG: hypothetical protein ABIN01_07675 [Ferruginibacter sp.]
MKNNSRLYFLSVIIPMVISCNDSKTNTETKTDSTTLEIKDSSDKSSTPQETKRTAIHTIRSQLQQIRSISTMIVSQKIAKVRLVSILIEWFPTSLAGSIQQRLHRWPCRPGEAFVVSSSNLPF